MAFTSYEELKAAVDERRASVLTLEVELGGKYSQEHEDAKRELATARGMKAMAGGFLGDNLEQLEARVAETKPESPSVWLQYRRIPMDEWSALMKNTTNMTSLEQYEKVLPKVFIGLFGEDPVDENDHPRPDVTPLNTSGAVVSSKGPDGILLGSLLHSVVTQFMNWQNSGGDVTIRPTRSGRS